MAKVWIKTIVLFIFIFLPSYADIPFLSFHFLDDKPIQTNKNSFFLPLDSLHAYTTDNNKPLTITLGYYSDNETIYIPSLKANKHYEHIIKELAYMQIFAIGTIGVIAALPENVSMWSTEEKHLTNLHTLLKKHAEHIDNGPVWDHDRWAINYMGHPLAGSYFYVWGRQNGLSWKESSLLTTLMSTFLWEYGWEAFAETPSTQDLIVTPILGSLLGEGSNYLYNRIIQNDGKIYNIKWLGDLGRGILNPIGEMNKYLDDVFHIAHIKIGIDYAYTQNKEKHQFYNIDNNVGMIQSYFKLNFSLKY